MLGQFRRVVTPEINAISTVFFLLSVVIVTLFFFLNRKKQIKCNTTRQQGGLEHEMET